MKPNQIRSSLDGIGTEQNVLYTNDEIIENLDDLQRALASGLFAATHLECTRAREIMEGIRSLAVEHGIESAPELQRLTANMDCLGRTIGSLIKGRNGEQHTMKSLQLLALDKNIRILYNIAMQDDGVQTEYDAIILAPYGVFVVEVKNYTDSMRITENGMLEKQVNPDYQYNLGGRMNGKEYLLRKALGDLLPAAHYHGILLYANELSSLADDYKRIKICYRNTIVQDVQSYDSGDAVFTAEQLAQMEQTLLLANTPKRYTCKVNCAAIKDDFAYLMERMAPVAEETDPDCAITDDSHESIPDSPVNEVLAGFSWKEFWCGLGAGAALASAAYALFNVSTPKGTRA